VDADPQRLIELSVYRLAPTRVQRARLETLPVERIDPVIRVAHRRDSGAHLTIPERVIVDHEIVLVLRGRGELKFRDRAIPFAQHEVLLIRPFVLHTFAGRGDVDHIAIHFDFAPRRTRDLERRHPYRVEFAGNVMLPTHQGVVARGPVERALSLVVEHFRQGTPAGELRARGEFLSALSMLLNPEPGRHRDVGLRRVRLQRALSLMRERITEPISARDLERASGVGSSHLHLMFRELTGYAPLEYLRRLRIALARELLGDAALSIKEVADRVGFSDANHFSRVFTRIDGVPPTAYREALLASLLPPDGGAGRR
jgi:AraC-like DNA-binding protein